MLQNLYLRKSELKFGLICKHMCRNVLCEKIIIFIIFRKNHDFPKNHDFS